MDNGNGGISHSEGQGYGMLLAVAAGDRETFETIWHWTRLNLQVRPDHLFIWRRRPGTPMEKEDFNNATDGDLLIAWALLEAAALWHRDDWKDEALAIALDLKRSVIRAWKGRPVLLPGASGFEQGDRLVLNLSYWVFPALFRIGELDRDPLWADLVETGLELLRQAQFGSWGLPSDWMEAGETLQPWQKRAPRFGYDAVRIPLYLIWVGRVEPERLDPFLEFWQAFGSFVPPWIDLEVNCLGAYAAPPGILAIRSLTRFAAGRAWWLRLPEPDADYYSATLVLLSRLAAEGGP